MCDILPLMRQSRIVVYFRWGLDFARVLFLLLIHVGQWERRKFQSIEPYPAVIRMLARTDLIQTRFLLHCFRYVAIHLNRLLLLMATEATQSFCNNAYLTFIIISWAMTGLCE